MNRKTFKISVKFNLNFLKSRTGIANKFHLLMIANQIRQEEGEREKREGRGIVCGQPSSSWNSN